MVEENSFIFKAPAKWERHLLCHSPGHLKLSNTTVEFVPGTMSILGKYLIIPIETIDSVKAGDNFLWRGVVHIFLKQPINEHNKYVFFLGGKRKSFLSTFEKLKA